MLTRFLFFFLFIISSGIQASQEQLDKAKACDEAKDYECALEIYRPLAEKGIIKAQTELGYYFQYGLGVQKNYSQMMMWYQKAAGQGDAVAQNSIGVIYHNGLGVKKDFEKAMSWYRKSESQGYDLAQSNIAVLYQNGQGVDKDYVEAMKWYRKAADQGDDFSQFHLGWMYAKGQGASQDYEKARKWYLQAAEQGHTQAQYSLGLIYANGQGVAKNAVEAVKWFRKAARQGDEQSYVRLGKIFEEGEGVEIDLEKAMTFYQKATELRPYNRYLIERVQRKLATTELFGEKLLYAVRPELREAIKGAGAKVKREEDNYFADLYNSSSVLKDSSELAVYYIDSEFASAQYTFPSHVDSDQIVRIRNMVASKYGQPSSSTGKARLGHASFYWKLEDGIELKVSRGWPDTTTYLTFTEPKTNEKLQARLAELKSERQQKEYSAQSNAF